MSKQTKMLTVNLPQEMFEQFKEGCQKDDMKMSDVIKSLISSYLKGDVEAIDYNLVGSDTTSKKLEEMIDRKFGDYLDEKLDKHIEDVVASKIEVYLEHYLDKHTQQNLDKDINKNLDEVNEDNLESDTDKNLDNVSEIEENKQRDQDESLERDHDKKDGPGENQQDETIDDGISLTAMGKRIDDLSRNTIERIVIGKSTSQDSKNKYNKSIEPYFYWDSETNRFYRK